ncbi:hypothetical protein Plhal304r1_c064g0151521 [Plasmopara halstedii]
MTSSGIKKAVNPAPNFKRVWYFTHLANANRCSISASENCRDMKEMPISSRRLGVLPILLPRGRKR